MFEKGHQKYKKPTWNFMLVCAAAIGKIDCMRQSGSSCTFYSSAWFLLKMNSKVIFYSNDLPYRRGSLDSVRQCAFTSRAFSSVLCRQQSILDSCMQNRRPIDGVVSAPCVSKRDNNKETFWCSQKVYIGRLLDALYWNSRDGRLPNAGRVAQCPRTGPNN